MDNRTDRKDVPAPHLCPKCGSLKTEVLGRAPATGASDQIAVALIRCKVCGFMSTAVAAPVK